MRDYCHQIWTELSKETSIEFRLSSWLLMTPTLGDRVTLVKSSKSFRNDRVRLISAVEKVAKASYARNNLNDPNNAIILRLHDLEKTYAHINKKCYYQTWAIGRLRDLNSIQIDLKVTDNVLMQRWTDIGKTS